MPGNTSERGATDWVDEDTLRETLSLVSRLAARGEEGDDAAIQAVAETTGASASVVRLALRSLPRSEKTSPFRMARNEFLALYPDVRRSAMGALLAMVAGRCLGHDRSPRDSALDRVDELFRLAWMIGRIAAAYEKGVAQSAKTGAVLGALFAGS